MPPEGDATNPDDGLPEDVEEEDNECPMPADVLRMPVENLPGERDE